MYCGKVLKANERTEQMHNGSNGPILCSAFLIKTYDAIGHVRMEYDACDSFFCYSTRRGYITSPVYNALSGRPCEMTFEYQTHGSASGLNVHTFFPRGFGTQLLESLWQSSQITRGSWTTQRITINASEEFQVRKQYTSTGTKVHITV